MDYVYRYWTTSNPTSPPRPTPLKWRTIAPSQLSRDGSDLYAKRLVKAFWNRLPPHFLPKIPENINTLIDIEVKEEVWRFSQAHHRTEVPLFEPQTFSYKWSLDGDPYQLLFVMRMSRRVGLIIDQFKVGLIGMSSLIAYFSD